MEGENYIVYDVIKSELKDELFDPLKGVGQDIIELQIDTLLDDGLLKDVPIVNTVLAVAKLGNGIRERFFLKKIISFLNQLRKDDRSSNGFVQFRTKMEENEKYSGAVMEHVMVILDSMKNVDSTVSFSKAFKAHVDGYLTWNEFVRMTNFIDQYLYLDIEFLRMIHNIGKYDERQSDKAYSHENNHSIMDSQTVRLVHLGFLNQQIFYNFSYGKAAAEMSYSLTKYGLKFMHVMQDTYKWED